MYQIKNLNWPTFLSQHWQQQPVLIKGGFTQFVDPLDEHELAGLAQEAGVDSRIVRNNNDQWSVSHGPFEDYSDVCLDQWSLLVQNVDRYLPQADQLMRAFAALPLWRMDDLMVSFSVAGGSVGCHLDQYDVFICQGKGQRHWRVYPQHSAKESVTGSGLRQVTPSVAPIIDEIMDSGDILYIPPGFAHHGVALTDCLNYSVGFRAPTEIQVLDSALAAMELPENQHSAKFYQDANVAQHSQHHLLCVEEIDKLRQLAIEACHNPLFSEAMLKQASQKHIDEQWLEAIADEWQLADLAAYLVNGGQLLRTGGVTAITSDDNALRGIWYVQGERFEFEPSVCLQITELLTQLSWQQTEQPLHHDEIVFAQYALSRGWWQTDDALDNQ